MSEENIGTAIERPKRTVFTVTEWPEVDPTYSTVLLRFRLPPPEEGYFTVELKSSDAQRLGQRLNQAGRGTDVAA